MAKDKSIIVEPSQIEKKEITNSIDPKTGNPTRKLQNKSIGQGISELNIDSKDSSNELKTITVPFNLDEKKDLLTFDYVQNGNSYTVFQNLNNSSCYYAYSIPNSPLNILEYGNSMYLLDIGKQEIRNFLNDQIAGYDVKDAYNCSVEELCWGSNSSINPNGTKIIFLTNRKRLKSQSRNINDSYEIWVKDLEDGSEKALCSPGYSSVLTWDAEDNVYFDENGSRCIYKLNLNDGTKNMIVDNIEMAAGFFPYLLYYQYDFKPKVMNLIDGSEKTVDNLKYDTLGYLISMHGNENVIIEAAPVRYEFTRDLVILNMKTLQYKTLRGEGNKIYSRCSWYDNDTILLTVQHRSSGDEETYAIKISELK